MTHSMETGEGRDKNFDVSSCLVIRQRDLRDSVDTVRHSGTGDSALVAIEREHEECTSIVAYRTTSVDGARHVRLIWLSWEADSSW